MPPQTPISIRLAEHSTASGSRKSQKWSSDDTNDIYERRQSGEEWHSIQKVPEPCHPKHLDRADIKQDYPNRTGNALRIRYWMVKAQKIQGDDKPVTRQSERQSPTTKRTPMLVDPHSIPSSSALSDVDGTTTVTSFHPQSSSRSTSNPARTEEWILTSPNLHGGHTAKSSSVGVQQEEPETSLANVADGEPMTDAISDHRPFKKPRLSTEPSKSPAQSVTSCSMQLSVQDSTPVVESLEPCTTRADDATILMLLSILIDIVNATLSSTLSGTLSGTLMATLSSTLMAMLSSALMATLNNTFKATLNGTFRARTAAAEAERDRRQVAFDAACGRANRRANEAEQKLEKERAKHSAITKANEQRLVEHENAKVAAEQSAKDAQAIIKSKDERLVELESLRLAAVDREHEVKAINEGLRKTVFEKDSELAMKEQQLKLYDKLRGRICSEIGKMNEAQKQDGMVLEGIKAHRVGFRRIWKLVGTDPRVSTLLDHLSDLRTECEGLQRWLDVLVTQWQARTDAFATFRTRTQSTWSEPNGSSVNEKPSGSIGCDGEDM